MSILDVLNSFIKNLVTAKSIDLTSDFSNAKHSSPYSNIGMHLLFTNGRVSSSDACLPTLPNMALDDFVDIFENKSNFYSIRGERNSQAVDI